MGSLIEAGLNTVIGFAVNLATQLVVFPQFDIHVPLQTNIHIMLLFTVISIARSYILRRYFNGLLHRTAQAMAGKAKNAKI